MIASTSPSASIFSARPLPAACTRTVADSYCGSNVASSPLLTTLVVVAMSSVVSRAVVHAASAHAARARVILIRFGEALIGNSTQAPELCLRDDESKPGPSARRLDRSLEPFARLRLVALHHEPVAEAVRERRDLHFVSVLRGQHGVRTNLAA